MVTGEPDELLSVAQAAAELGRTPRAVQKYIQTGRLQAQKIGKVYVIRRRALEAVREIPRGRPRRT